MSVSYSDIFTYLQGTHRPLVEGEAVFNAGHVVLCGKMNDKIHAFVLQTSHLHSAPHVVEIHINENVSDWRCLCSCKAGAGSYCKHIVAVLIYTNRNELEEISKTDLEQEWGKAAAKSVQSEYKIPVRVREFCHVTQKPCSSDNISAECSNANLELLLKCAPESALSKIKIGRLNELSAPHSTLTEMDIVKPIPTHSPTRPVGTINYCPANEMFYHVLSNEIPENLLVVDNSDFYEQNIQVSAAQCIDIYENTFIQEGQYWLDKRRFRITGSTCYELFTYSRKENPNWQAKISKFIKPTFMGNANTEYGKNYEGSGRACYTKYTGRPIRQCGLVINKKIPWLAFSPDGVTEDFEMLIEIKSPIIGKTCPIALSLDKINYIVYKNGIYTLRKHHKYYGQVQLGMFLLDIQMCHFILYSSFDDKCVVLEIERDESFLIDFLPVLRNIFVSNILPVAILCNTQNV